MELDADTANLLKGVYFQLAYMDVEDDILLYLGRDNDIDMDWENGVFTDNFRGVWGSIDGNLCYMEIVYEGDRLQSLQCSREAQRRGLPSPGCLRL